MSFAGAVWGLASPRSRAVATPMVLGGLGAGPSPLAGPAVGSRRWLEVLGSGGAEAAD